MTIHKIVSASALMLALAVGVTWAGAPGGGAAPPGGGRAGGGPGGPGGPGGRGRGAGGAPMNLQGAMSDMGRLLRTLNTDAADFTKSDATLRNIAQFERNVAICKMQAPPTVAGVEAAKGATDYKNLMSGLMKTLVEMEDHVDAKKADDVKKDLEKLASIEKEGHGEFRK